MSFIRRKQEPQFEEASVPVKQSQELNIRIDVAPIPLGASEDISKEKRSLQTAAVQKVRSKGKDLFLQNKTIASNEAGIRLYQTNELYSQNLAVEDLIPMLTSSDLTLRVNAIREGVHSHSTCMELKSGVLADLLEETADNNKEKTAKITLTNATERGEMFVSVKEVKGKHYINKVDYKINAIEDDRLHIK